MPVGHCDFLLLPVTTALTHKVEVLHPLIETPAWAHVLPAHLVLVSLRLQAVAFEASATLVHNAPETVSAVPIRGTAAVGVT